MASGMQRLAGIVRRLAYRAHRMSKPSGWIHTLTPDELEREVDLWYWSLRGCHVDFRHPRTFAEKMQWLKVHDRDPRKTTYSDKLDVREMVSQTVGAEVLPQVYAVWENAADIDFAGLPSRFILKCSNGSGMMMRIEDASATNLEEVRSSAKEWLTRDFASQYFEMHYADITPRVFAEEWIDDIVWEYQAWCFSGEACFIAAIHDPHGVNEKQFFSPSWDKLPFVSSPPEYQGTIAAPDYLEKIVSYSERLAQDFTFVRVDWYGTRHGLVFSEMSFTPAYGIVHWMPSTYDEKVGDLINLPIEDN